MELIIKDETYKFEATFGFYRELNAKFKRHVDGINQDEKLGAYVLLTQLVDRDVEALADILMMMNKNLTPTIRRGDLEAYIAQEADIDTLFDEVIDFLSQANMTRNAMKRVKNPSNAQVNA